MLDSGWATARVAPTRASSPGCSGRSRPCRFPDGLVGSVRDAARAWDATSYEGNETVLDSGWATARVAPTRASSPGCSGRSRPCRFPDSLVWIGTGRHKPAGGMGAFDVPEQAPWGFPSLRSGASNGVAHPSPTAPSYLGDRRRGRSMDNPANAVPLIKRGGQFSCRLGVSFWCRLTTSPGTRLTASAKTPPNRNIALFVPTERTRTPGLLPLVFVHGDSPSGQTRGPTRALPTAYPPPLL